jgi:pyruvate dehydrogenase E1 component alpha subunit
VTAVEHPGADRAAAYGLEPIVVDGNDVDAVYNVAMRALGRARSGAGPSLIEAKTYRHSGHSRADPGKYRPPTEVEEWMKRDPLPNYRRKLLGLAIAEAELVAIENDVKAEVDAATDTARNSPPPRVELAFTEMWDNGGFEWRN